MRIKVGFNMPEQTPPNNDQEQKTYDEISENKEKEYTLAAVASVAVGGVAAGNTYFITGEPLNPAVITIAVGATAIATIEGLLAYRQYRIGLSE